MQLDILRAHGLEPHHRVADIGAGPLRAGVWLMDFMDPGCYFALEPSEALVEAGKRIVGEELLSTARPTIDHNDGFDLSVFGCRFDFGVARSVWTHASMAQVRHLLRSWSDGGHGTLLASYLPTRFRPYQGDRWVGISHESDRPGMIRHRLHDIRTEAESLGLRVEQVRGWVVGRQRWLRIAPSEVDHGPEPGDARQV